MILSDGEAFTEAAFSFPAASPPPAPRRSRRPPRRPPRGTISILERVEKQLVEEALKKHSYNISLARRARLTRASLYRRMEKHGL